MSSRARSGSYANTGSTISALQLRGLSRSGPRLIAVKRCCDQAVQDVFAGHATVQPQGSTRKGTGVQGQSDIDLYVNLDSTIETVTHRQRLDIVENVNSYMSGAGILYSLRCGENRIQMRSGRDNFGPLPDTDLVFASYKHQERVPPDVRAMAESHVAQQVVRYIKLMPEVFSNLPAPHSFYTEQLVKLVNSMQPVTEDARGFEQLMNRVMNITAYEGNPTSPESHGLMEANLYCSSWCLAARCVLEGWVRNQGWLQVW